MRILLATLHLVFGLAASTPHVVIANGTVVDTLSSSSAGSLTFESDLRGRFEIMPVGEVPIPPTECPDLVVTTVHAEAPCNNGRWDVTFTIANVGQAPAGAFRSRVTLQSHAGEDPSIKCEYDYAGLPVGASEDRTCKLATNRPDEPVGQWRVRIIADHQGQVAESDETNNEW